MKDFTRIFPHFVQQVPQIETPLTSCVTKRKAFILLLLYIIRFSFVTYIDLYTFHLQVSHRFNMSGDKLDLSWVLCSHVAHKKKVFGPWKKNKNVKIISRLISFSSLLHQIMLNLCLPQTFCRPCELSVCDFCSWPSWRILMVLVGCILSPFLYHSPGTSSTEISQTNTAFWSSWMSRSSRPCCISSSRSAETINIKG